MRCEGESSSSSHLHHFRWDLDKTYLKTEFDSIRDQLLTFRQSAEEKHSVPGAATLLRELLLPSSEGEDRRVTFISGSPRQMRRVLTKKLRLDGIEPDNFILKPNLSNLLLFRLRAIRGQVGYKLRALLESRVEADVVVETLFGDDAELDAYIYSLYADLLEGLVAVEGVEEILDGCGVYSREVRPILRLCEELPDPSSSVHRIYIHLDGRSPINRFSGFGSRLVPIFNYFQAALLLYEGGLLDGIPVLRVVEALQSEGYRATALANSAQDLMRRGFMSPELAERVGELLRLAPELLEKPSSTFLRQLNKAMGRLNPSLYEPLSPARAIDYLGLAKTGKYKPERQSLPAVPWLR